MHGGGRLELWRGPHLSDASEGAWGAKPSPPPIRRRWLPWAAGGGLVVAVVLGLVLLPVTDWLIALVTWLRSLGVAGAFLFAAVYIVATVVAVPASLMTLAAGFAYGPLWGVALVSPASVLGAGLAFLLSRYALRGRVAALIASRPRLQAVDRAVGARGGFVVLLLRLSPVLPFNLLNYVLGLTGVRFWTYLGASFLGMLPGTFLYVYLGSSLTALSEASQGTEAASGARAALFWGGLAATLAVTVLVTRAARHALRTVLPDAPPATEAS